jgi:calcineurin-like phosphoesterase family protein
METYFIADNHFCHKNIIKYENRPFNSVAEMDRVMIQKWNAKVSRGDKVYILGDFILDRNPDKAIEIIDKLNGNLYMIKGNHDQILKNQYVKSKFIWVKDYAEIKVDDKPVILCHYPFEVWNKSHYNSISVYGHIHSNPCIRYPKMNQLNAGVDINKFEPVTLNEMRFNNIVWIDNNKFKFLKWDK